MIFELCRHVIAQDRHLGRVADQSLPEDVRSAMYNRPVHEYSAKQRVDKASGSWE